MGRLTDEGPHVNPICLGGICSSRPGQIGLTAISVLGYDWYDRGNDD